MSETSYSRAIAEVGLPADLQWRVTISRRRQTVGLTAEPGGSLTIRVPEGMPAKHVARTVARRLPWIARAAGGRAGLAADHPVKEFIDGENFPFLGRNRRLVLEAAGAEVRLDGDRLLAPAAGQLIRWYVREGLDWLTERAPQWSSRIGVSPAVILDVRDLGQRWGTCAAGKPPRMALHWALFQLSPRLIDAVIVHELAHLVEPRHGQNFNLLAERVIPDYHDRLAELAEAGRHLWMGAVRAV